MKIAVVGAGWAGMAAALGAARAGHAVTVFEAARTLGGRARAVAAQGDDGQPITLDNGQHILIGAYTECLALMRSVGVAESPALLRMPLALPYADGTGLRLPDLAPPWDALVGIARARGWSWGERLALLRTAAAWRLGGFTCAPGATVAQLCAHLPVRLQQEFIDPLCVSALNTPADQSSGTVFLRVLRDSLFSGRGGSHLLLPRTDLGALFPEPAAQWLRTHGHAVHSGQRVVGLNQTNGGWQVESSAGLDHFDAVVLATPAPEAARLVRGAVPDGGEATALHRWADSADALRHTAIATVYAQHPTARGALLPQPMLALRASAARPAQFVFDRAPLGGPAGLLAFVVSAFEGERDVLEQQVLQQAADELGLPGLRVLRTVVEKRATFACTPGLKRPPAQVATGLLACGDYVDGPYPATLEGAVRSGTAAVQLLEIQAKSASSAYP
ncbi:MULTISPECIES: hydroxysqualene dehydroxylase HpnE [unclassified Acidovorax]|uniref:hydroxysqualene dehydroxylase HpnE n=1 Tax=unclassified Acidovorax TaxID=2684926 RepID=UPI0028834C60|nr:MULTISPECIES: hydroxysqualene dehydroxylase HpnE [unclassified Acidovorax]